MTTRSLRKERIGIVSSDKMEKSVVVSEVKKSKTPCLRKICFKEKKNMLLMMKRMIVMRETL